MDRIERKEITSIVIPVKTGIHNVCNSGFRLQALTPERQLLFYYLISMMDREKIQQQILEDINKSRSYTFDNDDFSTKHDYFFYCLRNAKLDGMWLEFGVYLGRSIAIFADMYTDQKIYGFDSFKGLREDRNERFKKGVFDMNGKVPELGRKNIELVVGYFEDTLASFLQTHKGKFAMMHIDCDIYSATKCVFDHCKDRIVPGTVILFDELYNYPGFEEHEMKAFIEFLMETGREHEILAHGNHGQVCVKIM